MTAATAETARGGYADRAAIQAGVPGATGGPGAPAPGRRRVLSRDPERFPAPEARAEDWRFTPLDRLAALLEADPGASGRLTAQWDAPGGVQLEELDPGAPGLAELLARTPYPADRLAALAAARAPRVLVVRVPPAAACAEPVVLRLSGSAAEPAWGHVVVDIGAQAEASVVLEHTGLTQYGGCVSVLVGDGARLDVTSVHDWDRTAVHAGHYGFRVGRGARLRSTQVALGGDLVRIVETVEFAGPGGEVELAGLQLAGGGQHLESRLLVDHTAPQCRSRVLSKAALHGEGTHTVWVGDVVIGARADGTDTYETNRNLVLSDGARADSVPNLEIETGEVTGAGHASATGRFDEQQLFYLMTRGIPADQARRLVVRGFFSDVLDRVGYRPLHDRLLQAVDDLLGREESR